MREAYTGFSEVLARLRAVRVRGEWTGERGLAGGLNVQGTHDHVSRTRRMKQRRIWTISDSSMLSVYGVRRRYPPTRWMFIFACSGATIRSVGRNGSRWQMQGCRWRQASVHRIPYVIFGRHCVKKVSSTLSLENGGSRRNTKSSICVRYQKVYRQVLCQPVIQKLI